MVIKAKNNPTGCVRREKIAELRSHEFRGENTQHVKARQGDQASQVGLADRGYF